MRGAMPQELQSQLGAQGTCLHATITRGVHSLVALLPPVAQHLGQNLHLAAALGVAIVLRQQTGGGVPQSAALEPQRRAKRKTCSVLCGLQEQACASPYSLRHKGAAQPLPRCGRQHAPQTKTHLCRLPLCPLQQIGVVAYLQVVHWCECKWQLVEGPGPAARCMEDRWAQSAASAQMKRPPTLRRMSMPASAVRLPAKISCNCWQAQTDGG